MKQYEQRDGDPVMEDGLPEGGIEDPQEEDDELEGIVRYSISFYGADMPVDGLVDRLNRKDIFIPSFQRKFVWSQAQASRFIESLIIDLPVPGIFMFKEPDSRKLMVVDGQQRLRTLQCFHDGLLRGREFRLVGVSKELQGKTYKDLTYEEQRNLNDYMLHATIFRQDEPNGDRSSVYSVFERLNTGGAPLQPQEIRACVYRGKFNDLLSELSGNPDWKRIYGSSSERKKDEEIILRFFALYHAQEKYERPMKQFLNDFMEHHRKMNSKLRGQFRGRFESTVAAIAKVLGPEALRPERNLNVSVADAVLVGVAHRLESGPIHDQDGLRAAHDRLLEGLRKEELYSIGTTSKERVNRRIELARAEYETVK